MTISLRMSDDEAGLIRRYAKLKKRTVSDVMKMAIMEQIEDELDLALYRKAMLEHQTKPQTATFEEVLKEVNA